VITLNKRQDLRQLCPDDQCPFASDVDSERSSIKTHALVTDILIGSAVASTVAGILWLALDGDAATEAETSSVDWSVGCGLHGCSGAASVRF